MLVGVVECLSVYMKQNTVYTHSWGLVICCVHNQYSTQIVPTEIVKTCVNDVCTCPYVCIVRPVEHLNELDTYHFFPDCLC